MKKVPISQGLFSLVSNVDYKRVSEYKWHLSKGRARNNSIGYMHRLIAKERYGEKIDLFEIDHINRNPLDNRRSNLRLATPSQNRINTPSKIGKSGFRGVYLPKGRKKWRTTIQFLGKKHSVGTFLTAKEAAYAYDEKAKQIHGKFAELNFS